MKWFQLMQKMDGRVMYLLLAVAIAVPLIWQIKMPIIVSPAAQGAYDTVEKIRDNQIAIVSANWGAGTEAENEPQTEMLMRHLFESNKRFAIISWDQQGSQFAYDIAKGLAEEYGKEYGTDWVHFGYRVIPTMILITQALGRDVPGTIKTDMNGTPVTQIPMMKGIKTHKDIGAVLEITPSATLGYWIAFLYGPYRVPLVYAPTSVSGPEGFNYLDSGQIKGMLVGMKGAAEYEHLLGRSGFATRGTGALSTSHLLIIALIVIGNIGYISSRRKRT